MKTLLTPTPLIAVEIQEHENTVIWANKLTLWGGDNFKEPIVFSCRKIEILGTVDKGVIDFDADTLMNEVVKDDFIGLPDFTDDSIRMFCGEQSFNSLLLSHSLSLDKKYLIIKQK